MWFIVPVKIVGSGSDTISEIEKRDKSPTQPLF